MTTIIDWICENLCKQCTDDPYPQQEATDRIASSEIVALLDKPDESDATIKVSDLHITDRTFKLVDIDHIEEYLLENPVSERSYVNEWHDCDDFSYILQGDVTRWDSDLAFGIIHGRTPSGGSHAWNVCISTDKEIYFIEPQTDRVWKPESFWKIWLLVM